MANFVNPSFETNLASWLAGKKPSEIANIFCWYDAAQETYSDTNPVGTWTDRSGNGRDLTATAAQRPTFKTNIVNGNPVLRFNGTSNEMQTAAFTLTNTSTPYWGGAVFYSTDNTAYHTLWDGINTNIFNAVTQGGTLFGPYSLQFWTGTQAVSTNTWYYFMAKQGVKNTTTFYNRLNGGNQTANESNPNTLDMGGLWISHSYSSQFWFGDMAEMFFFNADVSDTNLSYLQSYLSLKYGITNAGDGLAISRDTSQHFSGVASAKLICTTTDNPFFQNINPGTTNDYILSTYVYINGSTVADNTYVSLYYDGSVITTTYTDQGGGWTKLTATVTGANALKKCGIQVKATKTIYADNFDLSLANAAPNTPTNTSPANAATNQSRQPILVGSAYSDPESNPQTASQWQIATDAGFSSVVWDTGTTGAVTSMTVNTSNGTFSGALSGLDRLAQNTAYYWRVRYSD